MYGVLGFWRKWADLDWLFLFSTIIEFLVGDRREADEVSVLLVVEGGEKKRENNKYILLEICTVR